MDVSATFSTNKLLYWANNILVVDDHIVVEKKQWHRIFEMITELLLTH